MGINGNFLNIKNMTPNGNKKIAVGQDTISLNLKVSR